MSALTEYRGLAEAAWSALGANTKSARYLLYCWEISRQELARHTYNKSTMAYVPSCKNVQ